MMTTGDFYIKWGAYTLALLPVLFLETCVLGFVPFWGAAPMVLPLCAIIVAVMEGGLAGAGFGLLVGVLCDALMFGATGWWTVGLPLLGLGAGLTARYGLRQNFVGVFLCASVSLLLIDSLRVVRHILYQTAPLGELLAVAIPEVLWSLLFVIPLYHLFHWVFQRVPKRTVL